MIDSNIIISILSLVIFLQILFMLFQERGKAVITKVKNKKPSWSANDYYWHITGKIDGEVVELLMTENDLKTMRERAENNPEDIPW